MLGATFMYFGLCSVFLPGTIADRACRGRLGEKWGDVPLRDDPLEHGARRGRGRQRQGARGALPALPGLLAPGVRFHLPARVFDRGRAGFYPGLLCASGQRQAAPARRPRARPVSIAAVEITPEFPRRRARETHRAQTRRRLPVCVVGRLDGGSTFADELAREGAGVVAGGTGLRRALGGDGG